jgi:hypothetical protein
VAADLGRVVDRPPPLQAPPPALVTKGQVAFGSYNAPVREVNLLDRWSGLARRAHAARLKEWQAAQLIGGEHFVLVAVYDTKSLGILQVVVVEKSSGRISRFEHKVPSAALSVGQGLVQTRSTGSWRGLAVSVDNDVDAGSIGVTASALPRTSSPGMLLSVTGDCSPHQAAHMVVCHPFADGTPLYSNKCAMAATGQIAVGERRETFPAHETVLIVDDHKGHYPSPMAYDWVTGARVLADGRRVAVNLTHNQVQNPAVYNENVVFLDDAVHRLPPVTFERPAGVTGPWRVRDRVGMVDVTFHPEVPNDQHVGPRRFLAEYYGPFGWLTGQVDTPAGTLDMTGFYGMGEKKLIRV